jgi:hypothetical protein
MQKKNIGKLKKKSNFEKKTKKNKKGKSWENMQKKKKECTLDYSCNLQYIVCG